MRKNWSSSAQVTSQSWHFYFNTDSAFDVVAFTVDSSYIEDSTFVGCQSSPSKTLLNTILPISMKCLSL